MKHAKLIAGFISLLASLPFAATAQTVSTTASDVLLGFRAAGGTGVALNLQIDLGAVSSYTTGVNSTVGIHTIGSFGSFLSSTYSSSWNTRSDLTWGIAAGGNGANKTIYGSFASTPGTQYAGTVDPISTGARNTAYGLFTSALTAMNGSTSTLSSTIASTYSTTDNGSWSTLVGPSDQAFQFFDTTTFENNTNISGGSYVVSDLYKIASNGTTSYVGTFALNSTGTLFFSTSASSFAAPVPEPATYAAIAGVLVLGAAVWRRQQKKVAAAAV